MDKDKTVKELFEALYSLNRARGENGTPGSEGLTVDEQHTDDRIQTIRDSVFELLQALDPTITD